ncbi:glycine cleavage system protein H [Bizionia arctica]|uniref:Glycine cleavage system protein H n=1 Tax=Bizionia arctica TaxID=1495645 RepID=A0A917GFP2_9FLAO|nr:glycine cleavage system protein H [Bizionia arctica]GGG43863.1 glycine cleavage system protein H [Bizionia arctica]
MQIPKNIYYTKQHLWLQKIGLYDFYVGLTDFGQKEIGTIDLIELTMKGNLIKKGATWGTVYGINETFNLIAPFDCEIIEKNKDLQNQTAYVNTAPYKYWFAIVTTKIDPNSLLTFQDYKQLTQ